MDMTLGERLRYYRKRSGLTQVEIAAKIGINQNTYSQKETDQTPVSADELMIIAKEFGITPNDLLGFNDIKKNSYRKNSLTPTI